jgi:hypothetical protein
VRGPSILRKRLDDREHPEHGGLQVDELAQRHDAESIGARVAFDGSRDLARQPALAAELVQLRVDVLAATERYVNAAPQATRIIRTVFSIVSDPVAGRIGGVTRPERQDAPSPIDHLVSAGEDRWRNLPS